MDAIETAIRNAFDKGDPLDPAYRQRVYRSAISAMEKALQANDGLGEDAVARRRETVRVTIDRIESEFAPATGAETGFPAAADERVHPAPDVFASPVVDADSRDPRAATYAEPRIEPDFQGQTRDVADGRLGGVEDGGFRTASRGGGRLTRLLPVAVVVLVAAAAIWWAASSGFFSDPETAQNQTEAPASADPASQPETSAPPLPSSETQRDWINVFSPANPTRLNAPANAAAEVMEDDSGRFIRIRSGQDGAPVRFGIGQGVLERIAGRSAVFNIIARAEEGMSTEIAIECDLGGLGDCGRKRYQVNYERGDFLFEVELPDGAPAAGGSIAITSDVENAGKAIDVYEIRVSVNG